MATASPLKSGAGSQKKVTMASARLGEKLAHLQADIRLGIYKLSNFKEERRQIAQESNIVQKAVATERRRQQEAKARATANDKKLAKRKAQAIRAGFSAPL